MLEIDGPGVTPATIETVSALELVGAYIHLLRRVGQEQGTEIHFTGLEIKDKCAALAMSVDVPLTYVRRAVIDANEYIEDRESLAPQGVDTLTNRVRHSLRNLPENQRAKIIVGKWKRVIRENPDAPVEPSAEETTSLRGRILRVGGLRPVVRLRSPSETADFSLRLRSEEVARRLAQYLYTEIDFVARIYRDEEGAIESGELEEFWPIDAGDPVDEWRAWFSQNAKPWNDVSDIEEEIRRGRE